MAIENLETGVRAHRRRARPAGRHAPGSKRGDVIVNVGGFQVGYVDGALFDLGDELRRRVDQQGRVTFLVFDERNRQLRSMPVTLVQQIGRRRARRRSCAASGSRSRRRPCSRCGCAT